ncbi:MAG: glucuronyl hydrolase [Calditrichaeota bacterium]|nr:MAG: glucuronyl hydrolase [Calditrichota bacterium]
MKKYFLLAILLVLIVACTNQPSLNINQALDYCVAKVQKSMNSITDEKYPRNMENGQTSWNSKGVRSWTSGFWPGILWRAYEYSGDEAIRKQAERFTGPIQIIANSKARNHDIGFMVFCSFGNGYRLTGSEEYKQIILAAADTLATLFNPKVGTIHSWPGNKEYQHNIIIDNMMNLELLFWASKNGGKQYLYDIAVKHAETTMQYIVRPDYGTYHVGIFDSTDGHFIKGVTHQGYADDSQWARGQAWGLYGFAMSYRETGKKEFLETSQKMADYFIDRLPKDGIPYWDFDDPKIPDAPKDASAAAIAASGMLELYQLSADAAAKTRYLNAAQALIKRLSSTDYLSRDKNMAFLLHSTGHHPKNSEIDVSIIYADYYFIEASLRLKKIKEQNSLK